MPNIYLLQRIRLPPGSALTALIVFSVLFHATAWAQSAYISCEENYIPPLINVDFPDYGQGLDSDVTIITYPFVPPSDDPHQPNPIAGTHSVLVYDPDHDLNRAIFYFNVNQDGTIQGTPPTSTTKDAKGNITSYSTVIGTYFFPGDNFPFTASTLNYQFPPVTDHRQYWLDSLPFDNPPPEIVRYETITSTFSYVEWVRWVAWLEFAEGPYDPNSAPMAPSHVPVVFDLQAMPDQNCPVCLTDSDDSGSGTCPTCSSGSGGPPLYLDLATAFLNKFDAGIVITDTPLSYNSPISGLIPFTVRYHQRYNDPTSINYSNLGPQWRSSWISSISGGPTNSQSQAVYSASDGSQYTYGGYEQAVVSGDAPTVAAEGDFQSNQAFSHATLHYRQGPQRYELWQSDGSVQVFAQQINTASGPQFFLSSVIDPQGNVTTLKYNSAAAAKGYAVLTSVSDPAGGQLLFSYNNSDSLKITKVTRSGDGLSATFNYTNGQLTSITDPEGLTSSYHYAAGTNFIDSMTTPYGTTTFNSTDGNGFYEADMTNPLGQTERVEYQSNLSTSLYPSSDTNAPEASELSINNSHLNQNNTFYWTRRAMADAAAGGIALDSAGFYSMAQVTHWATSTAGTIAVALSKKMPLESRVWYNYPGQNVDFIDPLAVGTSTSPSAVARLLDDGTTQVSFTGYNANGLVTQMVDPIGRTTNYNFDANGIDLLTITEANGSGEDVLISMTYNSQHLPLTITDKDGQTASLTYNPQGQMTSRTVVVGGANQTTSLSYTGPSGSGTGNYFTLLTGPSTGANTSYTYDNAGRVRTVTDSEGYTITNTYDNLDRLKSVAYPDGTSNLSFFNILDISKTVDRQGRATWNRYDAIRQLLQTTDPLGRTTKYGWCTCGGLSTVTDPNGHVTTWNLDLQGRATAKLYADGSRQSYVYESNTSRLHSMTDVRGDVSLYAYNPDNTLASASYTTVSGVAATPNVSFTYDPVYTRVTQMVDGTGTTSYSYNPLNSSIGAGRLASVQVPISGSTAVVAYNYDELGRVTGRTVDGGSTVTTTFDPLGRITSVGNPLGTFTYGYLNATDRITSLTYPSGTGLTASYSYFNNAGGQRLQTLINSKNGTVLSKFDYTYNPAGTIATWQQQVDSNPATTFTLGYDNADQLINASQTSGTTTLTNNSYNYDPAGNRLAETTPSGTTVGQFNSVNQLKSLSTSTGTQTINGYTTGTATSVSINALPATITNATNFTTGIPLGPGTNTISIVAKPPHGAPTTQLYQIVNSGAPSAKLSHDGDGNILVDENGNRYTWDALNRLASITYPSGAASSFTYDGLSRRVQIIEKNNTGVVTSTKNYLWIGQELAEERDAANTVIKRFLPQGEQQAGANYYYTCDDSGSVREMSDASGTIQARYSYDLYGKTTLLTGTNIATFQYTGSYSHAASGLNFTLYRAFDSNTGRWLSRDPLPGAEIFQGANLYTYCHNSPADLVDDLGLGSRFPTPKPGGGGGGGIPEPDSNDFGDDTKACFAGIIAMLEGIAKGDLPESLLPRYGNFCGPGYGVSKNRKTNTPDPVGPVFGPNAINQIDACCKAHDLAVAALHWNQSTKQADSQLVACLIRAHPAGPCGCIYRHGAIAIFKHKVANEN